MDLVPFLLYPGQAIDYRSEIRVLGAKKWPTVLDRAQLLRLTGEKQLDPVLASRLKGDRLDYFANGEVSYTLRGTHVRLEGAVELRGPRGRRRHARRDRAGEPRAGRDPAGRRAEVAARALRRAQPARRRAGGRRPRSSGGSPSSAKARPGLAVEDEGGRLRVGIPDRYRVGHEAHFAEVTARFLGYLKDPASLPKWEKANMLASTGSRRRRWS